MESAEPGWGSSLLREGELFNLFLLRPLQRDARAGSRREREVRSRAYVVYAGTRHRGTIGSESRCQASDYDGYYEEDYYKCMSCDDNVVDIGRYLGFLAGPAQLGNKEA